MVEKTYQEPVKLRQKCDMFNIHTNINEISGLNKRMLIEFEQLTNN